MTRWLKEPLLHFLLIGAGLFLIYGWQKDENALRPDQIVFTEAKIDQLINLWERRWQRLPTQQEWTLCPSLSFLRDGDQGDTQTPGAGCLCP